MEAHSCTVFQGAEWVVNEKRRNSMSALSSLQNYRTHPSPKTKLPYILRQPEGSSLPSISFAYPIIHLTEMFLSQSGSQFATYGILCHVASRQGLQWLTFERLFGVLHDTYEVSGGVTVSSVYWKERSPQKTKVPSRTR